MFTQLVGLVSFFIVALGVDNAASSIHSCAPCSCGLKGGSSPSVDCTMRHLDSIPSLDLGRDNLEVHLDLSNNNINSRTVKKRELCTKFPKLKSINLSFNSITNLGSRSIFQGCENLHKVNLGGNRLIEMNESNLDGLTTVKELVVEADYVSTSLSQLKQLSTLHLTYHGVKIETDLFAGMTNLTHLELQLTKCEFLPFELLNLGGLQTLIISGLQVTSMTIPSLNNLESLILDLPQYPSLTLDVDLSKLKSLTVKNAKKITSLSGMKTLENLTLEGIGYLPVDRNTHLFGNLKQLKNLDLPDCSLNTLQPCMFSQLYALKKLDLSGNNIDKLDAEQFHGLSSLTGLNLSNNKLRSMMGNDLAPLKENLVTLILNDNSMSAINKKTFESLTSLKHLDISNNNIKAIAKSSFDSLLKLQLIHLKNNQLSNLNSDLFDLLPEVREIDLSANLFTTYPKAVRKADLQVLRMNQNRLTNLPRELVCDKNKLQYLEVVGNPVFCDCTMAEVQVCIREQHVQFKGTCSAPEELRNEDIATFDCKSTSTRQVRPATKALSTVESLSHQLPVPPTINTVLATEATQANVIMSHAVDDRIQETSIEIDQEIKRTPIVHSNVAIDSQNQGSRFTQGVNADQGEGHVNEAASNTTLNDSVPDVPTDVHNKDIVEIEENDNYGVSDADVPVFKFMAGKSSADKQNDTVSFNKKARGDDLQEQNNPEDDKEAKLNSNLKNLPDSEDTTNDDSEKEDPMNDVLSDLWIENTTTSGLDESVINGTFVVIPGQVLNQTYAQKEAHPDKAEVIAFIIIILTVSVAVLGGVTLFLLRNRQGHYHPFRHSTFRSDEPVEIQMQQFGETHG